MTRCSIALVVAQLDKKKEARAERFGLNAEENRRLERAKRFNLEINSRAKDRVVSFGEKLSCRFMTYLLRDRVSCVHQSLLLRCFIVTKDLGHRA